MSVRVQIYVLLGFKLPGVNLDDDLYEELDDAGYMESGWGEVKEVNGVSVIYDSMDCRYVYVGKVIRRSDREDEGGCLKPVELSSKDLAQLQHELTGMGTPLLKKLMKACGDVSAIECKFHVFQHSH